MRANLTYAASEPGNGDLAGGSSRAVAWWAPGGRGKNGNVDAVGSGGVRGPGGAGPGRLWAARRLPEEEVVERDDAGPAYKREAVLRGWPGSAGGLK
jgi:hypothetical protein